MQASLLLPIYDDIGRAYCVYRFFGLVDPGSEVYMVSLHSTYKYQFTHCYQEFLFYTKARQTSGVVPILVMSQIFKSQNATDPIQ